MGWDRRSLLSTAHPPTHWEANGAVCSTGQRSSANCIVPKSRRCPDPTKQVKRGSAINNLIRHVWPGVKHPVWKRYVWICYANFNWCWISTVQWGSMFIIYMLWTCPLSKMIFNASLFTSISAPMADYIRCRKYCEESHYEQSVSWTLESAAALFRGQVNGTR